MGIIEIIAIAIGLGLDAMSVSAAVGVRWHGPRQKFRLAWHMGLFQFLMPVTGFLVGGTLAGLVDRFGSYIAAGLVFAVAAKMLCEALKRPPGVGEDAPAPSAGPADSGGSRRDPTRGFSLVALSVATSLDALVVGFSLGLKGADNIVWPSLVIGVTAAAMSLTGVAVGRRLGTRFGKPAEIAGAVVLMLLAVSFLVW